MLTMATQDSDKKRGSSGTNAGKGGTGSSSGKSSQSSKGGSSSKSSSKDKGMGMEGNRRKSDE